MAEPPRRGGTQPAASTPDRKPQALPKQALGFGAEHTVTPPSDESASARFSRTLGPARRVGLYGGTFDPVHIGHLIAAIEVAAQLRLDIVVMLPAGQPPHKTDRPITAAHHRVRMLELATAGRERLAVSSFDLEQSGPSYTARLLARAHAAARAPREFFFVMGADSLEDFANWREPATVARLAHVAVVTRPDAGVDLDRVTARVPALRDRVHLVAIPLISTSSSDLRERVSSGRPIAFQVPAEVERYISEHRLYR